MINEIFAISNRRHSMQIFLDGLNNNPGLPTSGSFQKENALVHPHLLRVGKALLTDKQSFEFELTKPTGANQGFSSDEQLETSDIFMMTHIGLGFTKHNPDNKLAKNDNPVLSYPDVTFFGAAAAKALMGIVNGRTRISAGNQARIPAIKNQLLVVNPNGGFTGTVATPTDHMEIGATVEERGLFELGAYPWMLGSQSNKAEVSLETVTTLADIVGGAGGDENLRNILVFFAFGWVFKGYGSNSNSACVSSAI
ncbi:MAG: hypothetical protein HOP11_09515 [Saprospiraceae bacterium]|nr:hypothetical protein [Saprospiraceae bacterium]